jgi:hypothetical protein
MKRPARVPSQLSESLHKRLSANTLAASAAGVSLLALAHPADAKIVYTPANLNIPPGAVPLDLNHDGVADFSLVYSGHTGTTSNGAFFERSLRATPVVSRNGVRGYRNFASALPPEFVSGRKDIFSPQPRGRWPSIIFATILPERPRAFTMVNGPTTESWLKVHPWCRMEESNETT